MAKRRAFLTLIVAAGLALSARGASAAAGTAAPTAAAPRILERATTAIDEPVSSLVRYVRDRLTIVHRALRGTRFTGDPTDGKGYHTDGISDGPEGMDPLGAKGGLNGAIPAQTRRPGS